MRKLVAVLTLMATAAWAGETFIGRIYVSDAGSASNINTGYLSAGCASQSSPTGAGACDQAFDIPAKQKITVQCDEICCISVNRSTTDAGICMATIAGEKFPTSTGPKVAATKGDGGAYFNGLVSITPPAGSSACRCKVSTRDGTE